MVENRMNLNIPSINQDHRMQDPKARSHRAESHLQTTHYSRCKSQEKHLFDHNHFTHAKIIKASHDIPNIHPDHPEHNKHLHEDHSRTVMIKKRRVSENFLLDSFPG